MLVYGVPGSLPLTRISLEVGVKLGGLKQRGKAWQFDLRPDGRRYRLTAASRRVCWHGYRDFLRNLFDAYPDAIVKTRNHNITREGLGWLLAEGNLPTRPCLCDEGGNL